MKWDFEAIKIGLSFIIGFLISLVGGYDPMIHLLFFVMIGDILSGIMVGALNRNINAEKMFEGGLKKISILLVIIIAVQIDLSLNNNIPIREATIVYYIGMEGISFIENISNFVKLPDSFIKFFKNIKKDEGVKDEH